MQIEIMGFPICYLIKREPDINDPGSIVMSEMTAFEKYKSWSVDIAKDIISYKVLDYVCEKMEHLTTEIRLHPEKIL